MVGIVIASAGSTFLGNVEWITVPIKSNLTWEYKLGDDTFCGRVTRSCGVADGK